MHTTTTSAISGQFVGLSDTALRGMVRDGEAMAEAMDARGNAGTPAWFSLMDLVSDARNELLLRAVGA